MRPRTARAATDDDSVVESKIVDLLSKISSPCVQGSWCSPLREIIDPPRRRQHGMTDSRRELSAEIGVEAPDVSCQLPTSYAKKNETIESRNGVTA